MGSAPVHGARLIVTSYLHRCAAVALWGAVVLGGSIALTAYSNEPSAAPDAAPQWPAVTALARRGDGPTLVMFAHPRCPCTRASVRELARIVALSPRDLDVQIVFYRPREAADAWCRTDLWRAAARIPGTHLTIDPGGDETARFGAATSGRVLLYDPSGRLLFAGGITTARGHEGTSAGRDAVVALARGSRATTETAPVFGCPITTPDACCAPGENRCPN